MDQAINKDLLADTFALLPKNKKLEVVHSLTDQENMSIFRELYEDELVDTLQELPCNMVRKVMSEYIDDGKRPIINELLGYPKERVGSIMSVNFLSITLLITVILSNAIGGLLPLVADKIDVDPTVMAGPIITTIVLLIYFEVASMLIGF